nr:ELWxxDGT repeat protein [Pleionea sp. CnH1-48]
MQTSSTINNGQAISLALVTGSEHSTTYEAELNIGGVTATFSARTLDDTQPEAFSFPAQTGVALNAPIESAQVVISGITGSSPISINNGEYSIDGGAFTSAVGQINNNQQVAVKLTSSGEFSKTVTAEVTIGGVSGEFAATTSHPAFYVHADDGLHGMEVWGTDGTEEGTLLLQDLNQAEQVSAPKALTTFGNELYLFANDGKTGTELRKLNSTTGNIELVKNIRISPNATATNKISAGATQMYFFLGNQLWVSNGSEAGTNAVKEIALIDDQSINMLTIVGDLLFFTANTQGTPSAELWVSNGTEAGTTMLKDFNQANSFDAPSDLVALSNQLLFSANDGVNGRELWVSNGTVAGTQMLSDIESGLLSSSPSYLTRVGSQVYFSASTASKGTELWKTDGTGAGTQLVKDIDPSGSGFPILLQAVGNELYFAAQSKVWKSDGTDAGTLSITTQTECSESPRDYHELSGKILFKSGFSEAVLCQISGSSAGLVKNIFPDVTNDRLLNLKVLNNHLYFLATHGNTAAIWRSDGTEAGTTEFKPANIDTRISDIVIDNELYMVDASSSSEPGGELWKTDGTIDGTQVININTATDSSVNIFLANTAKTTDSGLHFFNNLSAGVSLLSVTNGASNGATSLDVYDAENLTVAGDRVYFTTKAGSASAAEGAELWVADVNTATRLSDINTGSGDSLPSLLTLASDGALYFRAYDGTTTGLWKYTTSGGVESVKNGFDTINSIYINNDKIFFSANDGSSGAELWVSDGTESGTSLLKDIWVGADGSDPNNFTKLGNDVLFNARNGSSSGLWKTDGTESGTVFLKNVFLEDYNRHDQGLFNNQLYFAGYDNVNGPELWKTDGTVAGTQLVKDIRPGISGDSPRVIGVLNGRLLFLANDGTTGVELWESDGTASGTQLVKDINPAGDGVDSALIVGELVYLLANDNVHGLELWKSDGTAQGTLLLKDINSGSESSFYYPQN